jgi:hypothetical protein
VRSGVFCFSLLTAHYSLFTRSQSRPECRRPSPISSVDLSLQICVSSQEPGPSFTFSLPPPSTLKAKAIHSIHRLASLYYVGECPEEGSRRARRAYGESERVKKGLWEISWATVVKGPWPGRTRVCGGKAARRLREDIMSSSLPPGRSTLPIEPWNRASPEKSTAYRLE